MEENHLNDEFEPPPGPPPLLELEQVQHLAYHGWLPVELDEALLANLQQLSKEAEFFFDRSQEDKNKLYPPSRGTECGFYRVPEEKEYLTFRYAVHHQSSLEQKVRRVWQQTAQLLHRILGDLNRAGFYDPSGYDHLVEGSLELPRDNSDMDNVISLMRLFRYYPEGGVAEEHVDIGLLTLCIGNGKGLQVRDWNTESYVDSTGPVVLVGDMARALLNDRVRSGLHRVVGNPNGRSSVIFALRPCLRHSTDLSLFGGEGVVDTKQYFYKVKGKKYNINATMDVRQKQQKEQKEQRARMRQNLEPQASFPGAG